MARNTGKRRIHQKPMLLFVDQHLQNGGTGTARKPLYQAAAGDWHGLAARVKQALRPRTLLIATCNGVE